jgi:hypothetical protein
LIALARERTVKMVAVLINALIFSPTPETFGAGNLAVEYKILDPFIRLGKKS